MSDSGSQSHHSGSGDDGVRSAEDIIRGIHRLIVADERPDTTYLTSVSHRQKHLAIAKHMGRKPEDVDLGDDPPFDQWLRRGDRDSLVVGMYLADLRERYFALIQKRLTTGVDRIAQTVAEAEWWRKKFSDLLYTLNTGLPAAKQVLH